MVSIMVCRPWSGNRRNSRNDVRAARTASSSVSKIPCMAESGALLPPGSDRPRTPPVAGVDGNWRAATPVGGGCGG